MSGNRNDQSVKLLPAHRLEPAIIDRGTDGAELDIFMERIAGNKISDAAPA